MPKTIRPIKESEASVKKRTQEELDWLFLMICAADIDPQALQKLMETFGSPSDILNAGRRAVVPVVGEETSRNLFSDRYRTIFDETCRWLEKTARSDVVTWTDSDYPQALLRAGKAPAVLWIRGRRELLGRDKVVVIGTETPDAEGIENAQEFARALTQKEQAVVTGLAEGIETHAAKGALAGTADMIVVQSTGPDRLYPKENRDLFVEAATRGLIVSALPPTTVFDSQYRTTQLELMATLSQKLLSVQAQAGCPTLAAARVAAELGRDVYAIPGSIHSPLYKGNLRLLKQGAQLVETVADIVD